MQFPILTHLSHFAQSNVIYPPFFASTSWNILTQTILVYLTLFVLVPHVINVFLILVPNLCNKVTFVLLIIIQAALVLGVFLQQTPIPPFQIVLFLNRS